MTTLTCISAASKVSAETASARGQTTGKSPIMQPLSPLAIVPARSERITSGTIVSRRPGSSALMPAITIPAEEKFANPHMA